MTAAAKPKLGIRILQGLAGLVTIVVLATAGLYGYRTVISHPVTRVVFSGQTERLPQADLDTLTQAVLTADHPSLEGVRDAARLVPWVRDASVRRIYPDAIEITFTAHEAVARWDDKRLVSREGTVFEAADSSELPRLRGPEGTAPRMAGEFPAVATALAAVGRLTELHLTPRGAWEALLEGGLTLELGRGEWKERVERFVSAWKRLPEDARTTRFADLRYSNGFALRKTK